MAGVSYCFTVNVVERRGNDLLVRCIAELGEAVRWGERGIYLVAGAAEALEPHRLTTYLHDLAARFHGYCTRHRIISADPACTRARLTLRIQRATLWRTT